MRSSAIIYIGSILFIIIVIISDISSSALICSSGDCIIDCSENDCDLIICTDTANSCIINCGSSDCSSSTFYLSASINSIICDGSDSCKLSTFYCGKPDINSIPNGFDESNFNGHIKECKFILKNNAISDRGNIKCFHNIDLCLVQTISDNDDFKESIFHCELSPINAQCILNCYNQKSCGSTTSQFICNAPNCQCIGDNGCNGLKTKIINTAPPSTQIFATTYNPSKTPTITTTIFPTLYPSKSPTITTTTITTISPSVQPTASLTLNPSKSPTITTTTITTISPSVQPTISLTLKSSKYPTLNPSKVSPTIYSTSFIINTSSSSSISTSTPFISPTLKPTQSPTKGSHIFASIIRAETASPTLPSHGNNTNTSNPVSKKNQNESSSIHITSIYSKIAICILGGIAIFCSFIVVVHVKRKRNDEKKQEKKDNVKEETQIASTKQMEKACESTIDLTAIHYLDTNTKICHNEGEKISITPNGDETSDDETDIDDDDDNNNNDIDTNPNFDKSMSKYSNEENKLHQHLMLHSMHSLHSMQSLHSMHSFISTQSLHSETQSNHNNINHHKDSFEDIYNNDEIIHCQQKLVINPGNIAIVTVGSDEELSHVVLTTTTDDNLTLQDEENNDDDDELEDMYNNTENITPFQPESNNEIKINNIKLPEIEEESHIDDIYINKHDHETSIGLTFNSSILQIPNAANIISVTSHSIDTASIH